ncbi:unnamed protein product [Ceutorhynchus assimilis]|uniref:Uncharacterized protein n=1 Tax=Ceutorhynchus assimilis TaxID=467358 RepID=A0A9N9QDP9_9CUCU|nr:unnamed protein product [Ceutorhynchus assimilis]
MKQIQIALILGLFILWITKCRSSPSENSIISIEIPENGNATQNKEATVIDLEKINKMSVVEYVGRQIKSMWDYLILGNEDEPEKTDFIGRCLGMMKKMRQMMPFAMIAAGVVITKLGFLVLFSLKTLAMLGLLLLLNVGTVAAKVGAILASKKHDHAPQDLHLHVQPWKQGEHEHVLKGPPYGWDDRRDSNIESHDLYNLYEKLRFENNLKRYLNSQSYR